MSVVSAVLLVAGCSSPDHAPRASASRTPSASPNTTTAAASAFCLDLTVFQVGVVVFRGDTVEALRGKPLNFQDLKKRAALIARMGEEMRASAPPDIAPQFRAVLKAVKTSAGRLKPGARVRDIVDPLFNKRMTPAFDTVEKYKCH
jgi:hypothetical protein